MSISVLIEQLLKYGESQRLIEDYDILLARNQLLDLLQAQPYQGEVTPCKSLMDILEPMIDHAYSIGLFPENTLTYRDLFEARIMGILTPPPTEVINSFYSLRHCMSIKAATDYFYKLSKDTNYIKTNRIAKNLHWFHNTEFGDLEITINLSKPEKDPKEIALARNMPSTTYPKCLLCAENMGFAGNLNHPARQNHRIIPITLGGQQWYFQYSPYLYYNEHCIPLCGTHTPISISKQTFSNLLDFLELFPHYFVGSNADLPIVGGSMLTHDHYQGGSHTFPIEKAGALKEFVLHDVDAQILNWPMSVLRIKSRNKTRLTNLAADILEKWKQYEDKSVDIIPFTGDVPHNTVTPIARVNATGEYEFDIVLRNNRTSEEFPDGIFHPHPHVHHIKKENIGLIEVMGLAILPGRLASEVEDAKDPKEVEMYMGNIFLEVLTHAGVFKLNEVGLAAFERFIETI